MLKFRGLYFRNPSLNNNMRIEQAEEIESLRLVKRLEVLHPEILVAIKEYQGQTDILANCIDKIDEAILAQGNIGMDSVASVEVLLIDAVDGIMGLNYRALSIAFSLEDSELEKLLKRSYTYFHKNTKEVCIQKLDTAVKLLEDRNTIFTNIEQDDFDDIKAKIELYRTFKDAPRAAKVTKKADGTDALKRWVKKANKVKNLMIHLLTSKYKTINPIIAEKAVLLGTPVAVGTRHTIGKYSVIDSLSKMPILDAIISEIRTTVKKKKIKTKVYKLNADGVKVFKTHPLGKAVLKVVAEDFVNATMKVLFRKNEANEFVIGMEAVVPLISKGE